MHYVFHFCFHFDFPTTLRLMCQNVSYKDESTTSPCHTENPTLARIEGSPISHPCQFTQNRVMPQLCASVHLFTQWTCIAEWSDVTGMTYNTTMSAKNVMFCYTAVDHLIKANKKAMARRGLSVHIDELGGCQSSTIPRTLKGGWMRKCWSGRLVLTFVFYP